MSFFWNWSHIWKVILALCVRNEKLTQMSTLCFHLHCFLSVRGYSCTTAVVHFVISKRRIEFDLFGIDQILIYISLFYLHENMKL